MSKRNITFELEAIIDTTSLQSVLIGLELVCEEKAYHILENWQDKELATQWFKAARVCSNAARHRTVDGLENVK
jgi:hypothetical protein